ncbi:DUF2279 domain-containing protein [Bacteroidota bacterium]
MKQKRILILLILTAFLFQNKPVYSSDFFTPADSLDNKRLVTALAIEGAGYSMIMYGLHNIWYKGYEKSDFHFFNDYGEWEHIDKAGHIYTAYLESDLFYKQWRWMGMDETTSILLSGVTSFALQSSIEVFDGFSSKWGASVPDLVSNAFGSLLFVSQQFVLKEQMIRLKFSSHYNYYSNSLIPSINLPDATTVETRANNLFGESFPERLIKDYNAQTFWLSMNLKPFIKSDYIPDWLNLAVGYGAENIYGGFENEWSVDDLKYKIRDGEFPRFRQFYLSPDIDFTKIKVENRFLKMVLHGVNFLKFPAPSLEFNKVDGVKFWFVYF